MPDFGLQPTAGGDPRPRPAESARFHLPSRQAYWIMMASCQAGWTGGAEGAQGGPGSDRRRAEGRAGAVSAATL